MRIFILLAGFATTVGCSSSTTTPAKDESAIAKEIRTAIPEAAGMPYKEFERLCRAGPPSFDEWPNRSLSVVSLGWVPSCPNDTPAILAAKQAEFNYNTGFPPHPIGLFRAMPMSEPYGYATIIQPEFITEVTCQVDGDMVIGTFSFKAESVFEGRVEYTARRVGMDLRIEEFRLPAHQIRLNRQADGTWKQHGEFVKK